MLIEVKVPQLPESVSEATLLGWNKRVGEAVERDETLVGLETDKVVLDIPAPQAGVVVNIAFNEGDIVTTGQVIATIDTTATVGATADEVAQSTPAQDTQASTPQLASSTAQGTAMPAAKKLADENQINVADIAGTGRGGRVLKEDVTAHLQMPAPSAPSKAMVAATAATPSHLEARPEQRVPMSRLRLRVAERLLESQHNNAILTTFNEVNMKPIMDLRAKYKEKFEKEYGVKLGFMGFFVKAAVAALKRYPIINASIDGSDIVYHGYYDIGVAVSSPRGLVVPIIRNADLLTLAEIEKQIAEFGARAQAGKLTIEELTGGTYTISNGGVFGSMMSTPIINPPQSAILGMHATKERAVVENGQVVVRPMMYLAQSYDHRTIDGREAVLSLVTIKEALEDPMRLILEV
jgi:2-oxoglutarate dehydrogenase E2 component (dihydrolipoamide succinyltransferase)